MDNKSITRFYHLYIFSKKFWFQVKNVGGNKICKIAILFKYYFNLWRNVNKCQVHE